MDTGLAADAEGAVESKEDRDSHSCKADNSGQMEVDREGRLYHRTLLVSFPSEGS